MKENLEIYGFDQCFRDATRFLELYEGPLEYVVDIGAHVGSLSLLAAKKGATRVLAYEANPMTFKMLMDLIKENKFESIIKAKNLAVVGNADKERTLYNREGGEDPTSCLINRWGDGSQEIRVKCINFKEILKEKIDYLKLDIEGVEYELFAELTKEDLSQVRFLDLEVHHTPECNEAKFHERIKALGFTKDVFPEVVKEHGINAVGRFNDNFGKSKGGDKR